ncbi:LADA_0H07492g1_1 [Lachancea dasiensis]|uniref:LADA_0H07492g1_1 n=1 Tax=Lachancea dasiensis TaxID=1072105 RepID=A0A1G4K229_9SACH|nr:LADA_0H07492g1_1 [Lachancea dasiensis]
MISNNDNLVFEQVTDPEIIRFTHLANASSWQPEFMSREDYAIRERILGSTDISTKHKDVEMQKRFAEASEHLGIKYYVLRDLNLPASSKTSQIVSSCETLNRVGWSITPHSQGEAVPVLTACIGGVFTIPEHRGKKYAAEMITRLNQFFDGLSSTAGNSGFLKNIVIFLYSEVGEYYSKFGYVSRPVPLHSVKNLDAVLDSYCGGLQVGPNDRDIGFDGCRELEEFEKRSSLKSLKEQHARNPDSFKFALEPSNDNFKLFHERSLYQKKFLDPGSTARFGYALANGSHIVWHLNYWPHERSLYILKLQINEDTENAEDQEKDLKKLLAQAVHEAKEHNVKSLQFWDTELGQQEWAKPFLGFLQQAEEPSNLYQENPSRSAIRIANVAPEKILWVNNAKFCWF